MEERRGERKRWEWRSACRSTAGRGGSMPERCRAPPPSAPAQHTLAVLHPAGAGSAQKASRVGQVRRAGQGRTCSGAWLAYCHSRSPAACATSARACAASRRRSSASSAGSRCALSASWSTRRRSAFQAWLTGDSKSAGAGQREAGVGACWAVGGCCRAGRALGSRPKLHARQASQTPKLLAFCWPLVFRFAQVRWRSWQLVGGALSQAKETRAAAAAAAVAQAAALPLRPLPSASHWLAGH